jgi:histidinol phosphatase-like PHP family hydrolase
MSLTNARLADLLYGAAANFTEQKARALRRAARYALVWEVEAAALAAQGRSLTELPAVGPWVGRTIHEMLDDPPEPDDEVDPTRSGFITMSVAKEVLAEHPDWKSDLQGDLQMHSVYSDGTEPIETMARAAIDLGYSYIAITDHSKGLRIAGGMDEARLATQVLEIEELNRRLEDLEADLLVLRSIELNFDVTGGVDLDDDALAQLDVVVGSFHSKLRIKQDQTDRALAAARHPSVNIIGHPRGRMFGIRNGVQADWDKIFAAGAENGKAFEINAQPNRQDLSIEMLQTALEHDLMFTIGTDAHSIGELYNVDLALASAILAGVPRERIWNFRPPGDFLLGSAPL